ncbi:MAG TPA: outer membrane protein assembly factor BamD [Rectinemataceae bacterium]|nr:outer membrane protein assembly factor BamD [Rectinemataceae bacterium]
MKALPRGGVFRLVLGLSCCALVSLGSCATRPAAAKPSIVEKAPSPPSAPATVTPAPPPDPPVLSEAQRGAPPAPSILVLGLPSAEPGVWLNRPDLGQLQRSAPALAGAPGTPEILSDPALPSKLPSAPPALVSSKKPAAQPESKPSSESKAVAVSPTSKPTAAKEAASAKKPEPVPAPPAPTFAPALSATSQPAAAESLPSIPPSLVPLVDLSASAAPPQPRSFQVEAGGQALIPFVGAGWTYLGERDGKDGVLYDSRRFEGAGALFAIVGAKVGEYNLRFLRQDLVNGTSSEELVHLSVLPKGSLVPSAASQASSPPAATSPTAAAIGAANQGAASTSMASSTGGVTAASAGAAASGAISAPASAAPSATAQAAQGVSSLGAGQATIPAVGTGPATTAPSPNPTAPYGNSNPVYGNSGVATASPAGTASGSSPALTTAGPPMAASATTPDATATPPPAPGTPAAFIATARAEYAAGRAPTAIAAAQSYLALSPKGDAADEALFLEAQALELNSPSRDVAAALALYRRIVSDFPRSDFWSKANDRATYIQRFYFDIR